MTSEEDLKWERINKFFISSGLSQLVMPPGQFSALNAQFSKEYDEDPRKFIPYKPEEEWATVTPLKKK